MSKIIVS